MTDIPNFCHILTLCGRQVLVTSDESDDSEDDHPFKVTNTFRLPNGVRTSMAMAFDDEESRDGAFKAVCDGDYNELIEGQVTMLDAQFGKPEDVVPR